MFRISESVCKMSEQKHFKYLLLLMTIYASYAVLVAQANAQRRIREIRQLDDDRKALDEWRGEDGLVRERSLVRDAGERTDRRESSERQSRSREVSRQGDELISRRTSEIDELRTRGSFRMRRDARSDEEHSRNSRDEVRDSRDHRSIRRAREERIESPVGERADARREAPRRESFDRVDRRTGPDVDTWVAHSSARDQRAVGRSFDRFDERLDNFRRVSESSDRRTDIERRETEGRIERVRLARGPELASRLDLSRKLEESDSRSGETGQRRPLSELSDVKSEPEGLLNLAHLIGVLSAALMVSTNKQRIQQINEMVQKLIF